MRTEIVVNERYKYLESEIEQIIDNFHSSGEAIKLARNEIKNFEIQGTKLTVKRFKTIPGIIRFIFAHTSVWSKARRAYENSMRLLLYGLHTPCPIAYINIYSNLTLKDCFYICEYKELPILDTVFEQPLKKCKKQLKSFGRYIYNIHNLGVFHGDFSTNNVLYEKKENEIIYYLIDTNRMRFRRYTLRRGLANFERLVLPVDKMSIICKEYAQQAGADDIYVFKGILQSRIRLLRIKKIKHAYKRFINFFRKKKTDQNLK